MRESYLEEKKGKRRKLEPLRKRKENRVACPVLWGGVVERPIPVKRIELVVQGVLVPFWFFVGVWQRAMADTLTSLPL